MDFGLSYCFQRNSGTCTIMALPSGTLPKTMIFLQLSSFSAAPHVNRCKCCPTVKSLDRSHGASRGSSACNSWDLLFRHLVKIIMPRPRGAKRVSVPWRSCLGYRHAGFLQLSHRRPPEMCGLRTRPRTDVDPPRIFGSNCHRQGAYRLAAPGLYLVELDLNIYWE